MFESWGRLVYRRRRLVLAVAALLVSAAAVWGTGVFGALQSGGGFTAPGSPSQRSRRLGAIRRPRVFKRWPRTALASAQPPSERRDGRH